MRESDWSSDVCSSDLPSGYAGAVLLAKTRLNIQDPSFMDRAGRYWEEAPGLEAASAVFKTAQLGPVETARLEARLSEYLVAFPDTPLDRIAKIAENMTETARRNIITEAIQRIEGSSRVEMASFGGRVTPVATTTGRPETRQSRKAQEMLQAIQAGEYAGVVDVMENRESLESLAGSLKKMYEGTYGKGSVTLVQIDPRDGTPMFTTREGLTVKYVYDAKEDDEILYFLDPSTRRWTPAEERREGKIVPTAAYNRLRARPAASPVARRGE
jgi:hypothetical protein